MRVGVIGLGNVAPFFLRAIEDDAHCALAAVCDSDSRKLTPWIASGTPAFSKYEALLAAGLVDGIVIALPNHLHAPVAEAALRRGVHVCCEKPLTVTTADAQRLVSVARDTGRVLRTAFHRAHNSHVQALARTVARADAELSAVRATYSENILEHVGEDRWNLDPARAGGGCLIDNGPNALAAVQRAVGELELVDATIGDLRHGVEHYATLALRTPTGARVDIELDWALARGERKEIVVELSDGRTVVIDMLAGYAGLKSSLAHEYAAVIAEFREAVLAPRTVDAGPGVVAMIEEAYAIATCKERRARMRSKDVLEAKLVKLLFHRREDRGMTLAPWASRCIRRGEIHEIVTTVDVSAPVIDRVGFLGFAEFAAGGVLDRGDEVWLGSLRLGTVLGFDECHAPNHLNILIASDSTPTSADLAAGVGDRLHFAEPQPDPIPTNKEQP
jgi:L-arabinose 1-dehydrogenase